MHAVTPTVLIVAALAIGGCAGREVVPQEPTPDFVETTAPDDRESVFETPPEPTEGSEQTFTITLADGQPVGGIQPIVVNLNAGVEIVVQADATHEVHVHGYDLFAEVTPEQDARFTFQADIPGTFEIELEDEHRKIAELQVTP